MSFNVARAGCVLRSLHPNAVVSRSIHVTVTHSQVRRVCLATSPGTLKPFYEAALSSSLLFRRSINAFSTALKKKANTASKPKKGRPSKKTTVQKKAKKAKKAKEPKELSERQKLIKTKREAKQTIEKLKATALQPPKKLLENGWNLAVKTKLSEVKGTFSSRSEFFKAATDLAKNISQQEKENFAAIVKSNKEANEASYSTWIKSHSASQIRDANRARRRLSKLTGRVFPPFHDDRIVKRPRNSFTFYMRERHDAGDFKHMTAPDMIFQARQEWRGMTSLEKEKYEGLQRIDRERYVREYQEAYGEEPGIAKKERETL